MREQCILNILQCVFAKRYKIYLCYRLCKDISFMFQHCVILENIFTLPLVKMQRTNLFHLAFGVPSGNWCVFFRMHQDCEKNGFRTLYNMSYAKLNYI